VDVVEVGGLRVAFERRGTGPPLVLLHGILQDGRAWRPQLDALSDEWTVVAWDAPGCGRSSDPPDTFRLPEYADILAAVVVTLGLERPHVLGLSLGGALALWCVATFALVGKGTPAPFDPPRRLVMRGPYRIVRNPMYLGAVFALAGAALYYESWPLVGYTALFLLATHLFVVWYEEPTLRRTFGQEYDAYCRRVRRWWPTRDGGAR